MEDSYDLSRKSSKDGALNTSDNLVVDQTESNLDTPTEAEELSLVKCDRTISITLICP